MMKKEFIFIAGLYTLIQSITIGCFMVYIALKLNAQEQFINLESGEIYYLDLAAVFVSWFVGSAVFCSAIFALVFFLKYITRR
jgi:hypothetical protein